MKNIIIYATKYGSTEKAAKMLKSKLTGDVLLVNVLKEKVPSLEEYDQIILGGSIYMGRVQKELTEFIEKNLSLLLKKKVGLFICAGSPDPAARQKELETVFPAELYNHASTKELFGYELTFEKMGFLDKTITRAMKGDKNSVSELNEAAMERFAKVMLDT
ncbi:MAG: flavodoxin domain-containing protein [Clostridia bacterium]|nr:flavodoxin domain-containing protein [Clostridia bacterium]